MDIKVKLAPNAARILENMRAEEHAEKIAPPLDDPKDEETKLRNSKALRDLSRAYAQGDDEAAIQAKERLSKRARWELDRHQDRMAVLKPDSGSE